MNANPVQVLLVTGPLGSGKTTMVNALLRREIQAGRRVAVLINEFGTIGIDAALVAPDRPELAGLESLVDGCACCSLRSEVLEVLRRWSDGEGPARPARVVLETTGLADPTDLMDLDQEPLLQGRIRLAGCLTVLSCLTPLHHLAQRALVRHQVALASLVYLSKADLDPSLAMAWEGQIRARFQAAAVVPTRMGEAPIGSPDPWQGETRHASHEAGIGFSETRSLAVRWTRPVDPEGLEALLRMPLPGGELMRAKGVVRFQGWPVREDGSDLWVFHLADGRVEVMPLPDRGALPGAVVIGQGLDLPAWRTALLALEGP
jgi:G3E family GTPase